jgi:hypothetical protein
MSGKSTMRSFTDFLGTAKLPERTLPVCMRGDLVAEFEDLNRQLEEAEETRDNSLDAGSEVAEILDRIKALQDQMKTETYVFRLRALPRRAYRALMADHPPRRITNSEGEDKIHEQDQFPGVNAETFFEPLLRASIIDPELDEPTWLMLLDRLTDRQFEDLALTAFLLNRNEVDVPFSSAASRLSRTISHE